MRKKTFLISGDFTGRLETNIIVREQKWSEFCKIWDLLQSKKGSFVAEAGALNKSAENNFWPRGFATHIL